jgi:TatD DNase family protein
VKLALPPLDCHAHVDTGIAVDMLRELRAVVVAVTREPREWNAALARRDAQTLWAIGAHPGIARALRDFDPAEFRTALTNAVFVGEVGLDARAKTDRAKQAEVFAAVLEALSENPRPVTIHSTAASGDVLTALRARPIAGAVLHWWRGSAEQTKEAVAMGCFFSINGHEIRTPRVLGLVPEERLLTETDFPHTQRYDRAAARPGSVETVEAHLETRWDVSRLDVRRRLWRNLGSLLSTTDVIDRMPRSILGALATAGYEG